MSLFSCYLKTGLDFPSEYTNLFFDLWGVLWDGNQFYPYVLDTLKELKAVGKHIYILSNSTELSAYSIPQKEKKGLILGVHYDDYITSGDACRFMIQEGLFEQLTSLKKPACYTVGRSNPALFKGASIRSVKDVSRADIIYLSGLDLNGVAVTTIDPFIPFMREALEKKLPAVCANPDYTYMKGDVSFPANGALGKWYEENGGHVCWIGKPYANIYRYVFQRTKANPQISLMIGDTLRTDIEGGKNAGMKTVLVTHTGVVSRLLKKGEKIADLLAEHHMGNPDYILEVVGDVNARISA